MARNPDSKRSAHDAAWLPVAYEKADVAAMQALDRGDASPDAQKRALAFIVNNICRTYDLSFRPDSPRVTDFAEGKRYVGTQIVTLIKLNLSKIQTGPEPPEPSEQG